MKGLSGVDFDVTVLNGACLSSSVVMIVLKVNRYEDKSDVAML
jgi:hypothetical protein